MSSVHVTPRYRYFSHCLTPHQDNTVDTVFLSFTGVIVGAALAVAACSWLVLANVTEDLRLLADFNGMRFGG